MQAGEFRSVGHRQHGDVGVGVVLAPRNGQGPEMRRRPGKDDQKQQQGLWVQGAGDGGPAQHRRRGTGGAAYNNVLGRGPFQVHGINKPVPHQGYQGQPRRQYVNQEGQYQHGDGAQEKSEDNGGLFVDMAAG